MNYESVWTWIIGNIFSGGFARLAAFILFFLGLYVVIGKKRLFIGTIFMGLSLAIAFGSALIT